MRLWAVLGAAGLCVCAHAQMPDVRIRLDGFYTLTSDTDGHLRARLYDSLGNRALVGVTLFLEPGFRGYFSQRLQQIQGDPDKDSFDEYYIEDPGLWRLGKQYLPFGSRRILRESALAATGDTNLVFEGLPVTVSVCDGGQDKQRGFVGRIGGRIGMSFAVGKHFGIGANSLNYVRDPESSPGPGRGYRQVYGADFARTIGTVTLRGEAVLLRDGETTEDKDESIFDASITVGQAKTFTVFAGATRSGAQGRTYYRVGGSVKVMRNLVLEPLVRLVDGRLHDLGLTVRVRF